MTRRRTLALLIALAAVASLTFAPGAFSAVTAERGVSVSVVDDEMAYLGLDRDSPLELPPGETPDQELVRLTNQFPVTLEQVTVSVTEENEGDTPDLTDVNAPATLDPGESGSIAADVDCGTSGNEETITVAIEASGRDGSSVELSREITIDCEGASDDGPAVEEFDFKGCSEVWIVLGSDPGAPFDATFRVYDSREETTRVIDNVTVNPGELETVPGLHGDSPLYKFDVHDYLGDSGDGDDRVLGAAIEGDSFDENTHQCAAEQRSS